MLAGVAGTIILIFVLLPCRGDENDEGEREKEREREREREREKEQGRQEDNGGTFARTRKEGREAKVKDS